MSFPLVRAKRAFAGGPSTSGFIKGEASLESGEGLMPGFSASGQDVWIPRSRAFGTRPGLVLSAVGARCGKVFMADVSRWGTVANTTAFYPDSGWDLKFLYYLTNDESFWIRGGAAQPYVQVPASLEQMVPKPELNEQRRIAGFLDRETAQIDALIAKQQQLISTLAERRASVVGFSMTRGMADSATLKDSGVYWLGDIPSHWRVNRFSRVVRINAGQIDPREPRFAPMTLIAPNHIQKVTGRILTLETAQDQGADSGKYFVRRGQVIYSKIRPGLRKATIAPSDCLCSADMYALSADPSQLRDEFLLELMLSEPFTQFTLDVSARVAMPKVNQETLSAASLWYPSLEEQDRILSTLHSAVERIDTLDLKARELTGTLLERRQALISAAVTGQINVGGAST